MKEDDDFVSMVEKKIDDLDRVATGVEQKVVSILNRGSMVGFSSENGELRASRF